MSARLGRRHHRRDAQLHERPDGGEDHVASVQEPREVGRRGDIDLGHREIGLEAVGQRQHLAAASPDQRRRFASCEQLPEHPLPGVSRRAQQDDPAFVHGPAFGGLS